MTSPGLSSILGISIPVLLCTWVAQIQAQAGGLFGSMYQGDVSCEGHLDLYAHYGL